MKREKLRIEKLMTGSVHKKSNRKTKTLSGKISITETSCHLFCAGETHTTNVSGGQLKYGNQFFFQDSMVSIKYANTKMAVGGKFLCVTSTLYKPF